jgi:hypothetical protein
MRLQCSTCGHHKCVHHSFCKGADGRHHACDLHGMLCLPGYSDWIAAVRGRSTAASLLCHSSWLLQICTTQRSLLQFSAVTSKFLDAAGAAAFAVAMHTSIPAACAISHTVQCCSTHLSS